MKRFKHQEKQPFCFVNCGPLVYETRAEIKINNYYNSNIYSYVIYSLGLIKISAIWSY